jgi:hypothetical protein
MNNTKGSKKTTYNTKKEKSLYDDRSMVAYNMSIFVA